MVCTGDILIFGIQMSLEDVIKYILKFIKSNPIEETYKKIKEDLKNDDKTEIIEYINNIFKQKNLSIEIIRPRCCLFSDDNDDYSYVYLGVELCSNDLVSRFDVKKFNTIEEYENFYTEGLINAKDLLNKNKNKYIDDLKKIVKTKPMFYTLPNDCFSCT